MLFSVIVPIYNVEKYLKTCVNSVLAQTFRDFELILVDDGSKDNCGKMIDAYAAQDSRVVVIHKSNGGLVSARKAGVQKARGEYVVALDGDDWIVETTLETIAAALNKYKTQIVCYGFLYEDDQTKGPRPLVTEAVIYDKDMMERECYPTMLRGDRPQCITPNLCGKAVYKPLYEKLQNAVDNRITMGEDSAVVFPCMYEAESICFLPECLYYYRSNPDSMVRSKKKLIPWEGALLRIEHYKKYLPLDKYGLDRQLGCYAAHAVFNVILSQMKNRSYAQVKKETERHLASKELMDLIRNASYSGSFSEKIAQFVLRKRWLWLIKVYSLLRN